MSNLLPVSYKCLKIGMKVHNHEIVFGLVGSDGKMAMETDVKNRSPFF